MLRPAILLLAVGHCFGARLSSRSRNSCAEAVTGAEPNRGVFAKNKCMCPEGQVLSGGPPSGKWACVGKTGFDRYFQPEDVAGQGCSCAVKDDRVGQGHDGNPFGWDRYRRCDDTEYSPPCGLCEGVGGVVDADEKTKVTLASCEVIADFKDIDPKTVKRPIWDSRFTLTRSSEILIGPKQDPACFQSFPGNTSEFPMCYKPQEVKISYDMIRMRALRLDVNQAGNAWGIVGNVSSVILHQNGNMWITNTLPLGLTQTICAAPREGADISKDAVSPLQYNWTDTLRLLGREKIDVEYGYGLAVLDHWIFGPHHVWTNPETGDIVRMWQPFNGLQVFHRGAYSREVDDSLFSELLPDGTRPPKAALEGGSTFRVSCNEDGFNSGGAVGGPGESVAELASVSVGHGKASVKDLRRARTKVPRSEYKGSDFEDMSATLNKWLVRHAPNSRECDSWTVAELQQLQMQLLVLRDPQLDGVYHKASDNRRLRTELMQIQQEWEELNALAEASPELERMHRDGHCHEAVMWYVHHLPEDVKTHLKDTIALPLLSRMRHEADAPRANVSTSSHRLLESYSYKVSCADCHSSVFPK